VKSLVFSITMHFLLPPRQADKLILVNARDLHILQLYFVKIF